MLCLSKNKIRLLPILTIIFSPTGSLANDTFVEFNSDVLDASDRKNVDLNRFSTVNYVTPGSYLLNLRINNQSVSEQSVTYIESPKNPKNTIACLTPEQVNKLALKDLAREKINHLSESCLDIATIPGVEMNNHEGMLDITVPQAWMKYNDPDWVPPERWNNGIPGLLVDYSLTGQSVHSFRSNENTNSLSGYGQAGFNVGAWRFRSEYQANYTEQRSELDWNQFYAYRPLPSLAAKATVGEVYLDSQVFDSVRFTGINLKSDERMLPPALQGYAPEIRGIAKGNAKVTVSQNQRIIYQTTVPAGPFTIQDLRSSVRGTLDVKVEEQDGSVSEFQVDTANLPYLTRPGYTRYNTSIGVASRNDHKLQGPAFYVGDFSRGMSNAWSLYGGLFLAGEPYQAWSLGVGRDLNNFGTLATDITQSRSKVADESAKQGYSFKLSYAKTFDQYQSSITFAGYRFSQKTFRTFSQYLDERYQQYDSIGREKEMYTITANKTFWADDPDWVTSMFLTYTHQNYWDRKAQQRYGITVGRPFRIGNIRGISSNLSLWRSLYNGNRNDTIALSVSVPLGESRWIGWDMQHTGNRTTNLASYSNSQDMNNLWRVRAGMGQNEKAAFDGYYQHRSGVSDITGSVNYQAGNFLSAGGSVRGGVTATQYGAAAHNSSATLDTARVVVDTAGIANVPLNGKQAWSNRFGIAVVPDVVSYNSFDTRVDVDALGDDIEASKAISTDTLTEGAIGFQRFSVVRGQKLMTTITRPDGSFPPFGAEILNKDGISVAMVMEQGLTWLAGVNPQEKLSATWQGKRQCEITLPPKLDDSTTTLSLKCQ